MLDETPQSLIDEINSILSEKKVKKEEANDFNYAAAKAKLAGKSKFDYEGKSYPVTMDKKDAQSIVKSAEENVEEDLEKDKDDPCWAGYVQVGTKMKNGKEVPNCVPMDEDLDEDLEKDKDDPCWAGYVQVGTKMKNGKEVPNCVPMDEDLGEDLDEKKMSTAAKRKAAKYRQKNKQKIKKYQKKYKQQIQKGSRRVNKKLSKSMKKARKKPGIRKEELEELGIIEGRTTDDHWAIVKSNGSFYTGKTEIVKIMPPSKNGPSSKVIDKHGGDAAVRVGKLKKDLEGKRNTDKLMKRLNESTNRNDMAHEMGRKAFERGIEKSPIKDSENLKEIDVFYDDGRDRWTYNDAVKAWVKGWEKASKGKSSKNEETQLDEKAVSKKQQKLMGMAYALKKGEMDRDEASAEVKRLADTMSLSDLKDFAETEHDDLPTKKESVNEDFGAAETSDMMINNLRFIAYAAEEVMEKIEEGMPVPEWYQNKVAKVHGEMEGIHSYMEGEDYDYDDEEYDYDYDYDEDEMFEQTESLQESKKPTSSQLKQLSQSVEEFEEIPSVIQNKLNQGKMPTKREVLSIDDDLARDMVLIMFAELMGEEEAEAYFDVEIDM